MLGNLAVCEAADVDEVDGYGVASGWHTHEHPAMGATTTNTSPDFIACCNHILNRAGQVRQRLMQIQDEPLDTFCIGRMYSWLMLHKVRGQELVKDGNIATAEANFNETAEQFAIPVLLRYSDTSAS